MAIPPLTNVFTAPTPPPGPRATLCRGNACTTLSTILTAPWTPGNGLVISTAQATPPASPSTYVVYIYPSADPLYRGLDRHRKRDDCESHDYSMLDAQVDSVNEARPTPARPTINHIPKPTLAHSPVWATIETRAVDTAVTVPEPIVFAEIEHVAIANTTVDIAEDSDPDKFRIHTHSLDQHHCYEPGDVKHQNEPRSAETAGDAFCAEHVTVHVCNPGWPRFKCSHSHDRNGGKKLAIQVDHETGAVGGAGTVELEDAAVTGSEMQKRKEKSVGTVVRAGRQRIVMCLGMLGAVTAVAAGFL